MSRLNPLTRTAVAIAATIVGLFYGPWYWAGFFVVSLILVTIAGNLKRFLAVFGAAVLPVGALMFALQFLFTRGEPVLVEWWIFEGAQPGLDNAIGFVTRMFVIATGVLLINLIDLQRFARALEQRGMSARATYVMQSTRMIIPEMQKRASAILDAQRARGIETDSNLLVRLKALFPAVAPLILNSLTSVEERAMSLEATGMTLRGDKSSLVHVDDSGGQSDSGRCCDRDDRPDRMEDLAVEQLTSAVIEIDDLSFSYPLDERPALANVDLSVDPGEMVCIMGANGAGKSTRCSAVRGLVPHVTKGDLNGSVRGLGRSVPDTALGELARDVGYVFQNPDDQIFNATVLREVEYALKRTDLSDSARRERVAEALALAGLTGDHDTNPYDMPPSVRKFVTIASVIANDTDVMILDEPTAEQDLVGLNRLMQLLRTLQKKGMSVITTTHDMEFVSHNFTRTVVMANRQLLRDTATDQVFYDTDALQTAHVDQPAFVQVADHFGGPEIGLRMNRLVDLLRPARPDDPNHSDHEEPSDD